MFARPLAHARPERVQRRHQRRRKGSASALLGSTKPSRQGEPAAAVCNIGQTAPDPNRRTPFGWCRLGLAGVLLHRALEDRQPDLKCNRCNERRNRAGVWIRHLSEPLVPRSDREGRALLQTSRLSFSGTRSTRSKRLRARTETPARRRERTSSTVATICTAYQRWPCPRPSKLADHTELICPQKPALRLSVLMHLFCNTSRALYGPVKPSAMKVGLSGVDGLSAHPLAFRGAGGARVGARLARRMFLGVLAALRFAVLTPNKSDLRHRWKVL